MSQRLVTTDDHTGTEISNGIDKTEAKIVMTRNGEMLRWDALNLSDESWDALKVALTTFLPDAELEIIPNVTADDDDDQPSLEDEASAAKDEARATQTALLADAQSAPAPASTPKPAPAPASAASSTDGMTQAQRKALSAAKRAWWYGLTDETCKALSLPVPNREINRGKLPPAVDAAYLAHHS
jgi:hypothetical protein